MISIIVTAYEAPIYTKECIKRILAQDIPEKFELIAACPDEPTKKVIMDYKKKYPRIIKYVKQEYSCPKNELMNQIMKIAKGRILVWTDGNKFFEKNAINELIKYFEDEKVGIVGGQVIPANDKNTLLGTWAYLLAKGINEMRKSKYKKSDFIEHTSNILAMRNGIIKKIPLDVAEGSILSFLIFNKKYKSIYAEDAKVRVLYPVTFEKFIRQRFRSAKAHMALQKYMKRSSVKYNNFYNEALINTTVNLSSSDNLFYFLLFFFLMIFVQARVYYALRIRKNKYVSIWKVTNKNV